jgi:hypothetical protein
LLEAVINDLPAYRHQHGHRGAGDHLHVGCRSSVPRPRRRIAPALQNARDIDRRRDPATFSVMAAHQVAGLWSCCLPWGPTQPTLSSNKPSEGNV